MNRQPFETPPCWWAPKLSPGWLRLWRPVRRRKQRRVQQLRDVEVRGGEIVRRQVEQGHGVLITPNHAGHADCFSACEAADRVGLPFYYMIAWQVFQRAGWLTRLSLQHHGCFSVDREGTDLRAFRQAVEILKSRRNPLVVFPEGEVYHVNRRVTPFREGPAAMALLAARKGDRPVVCVPCSIVYTYVEDPMPNLLRLMDDLERAILWRPRPEATLQDRIYRLARGGLALKELEFLGATGEGSLPDRLARLIEGILGPLEERYHVEKAQLSVPERIKTLRQQAIKRLDDLPPNDPQREAGGQDLDDLFTVVQLFSYPGNYVAEKPTVERMAETLDKFEEDILGVSTATIRDARKATVTFGEPIPVSSDRGKGAAATLTRTLEQRVQEMLDEETGGGC